MQLPALLTSDLHLTAAESDAYRWNLFPWLRQQCEAEGVRTIGILGDTTDAKDYHPSALTNRVVDELLALKAVVGELFILSGNHDWLREGHSYFEFLNHHRGIHFITKPYEDMMTNGVQTLWLPYTKNPRKDWANIRITDWFSYIFMHQTAPGSIASNGQKMDGEELPHFNGVKVYSGDIHVPQIIGGIEYVGSPYHVHHGDNFKPRCVLIDKHGKAHDLHFQTVNRLSVKVSSLTQLHSLKVKEGDHIKITVELDKGNVGQWAALKREAAALMKRQGVRLNGVKLKVTAPAAQLSRMRTANKSDAELIAEYAEMEELGGEALDVGLGFL